MVENRFSNADRTVYWFLLLQAPVLLLSGLVGKQLLTFSMICAVLVILIASLLYKLFKGTPLFSITAAVLLMSSSAMLIQSQLGMIEMHFHIFAAMPVFLIYQRWTPIIAALLTVAVHHITFNELQMLEVAVAGMPIVIFEDGCSWAITLVHAAFAATEAVLLCIMATQMEREKHANLRIAEAIQIVSADKDLSIRLEPVNTPAEIAFNNMMSNLNETFFEYRQIADQLIHGSATLDRLSQDSTATTQAQSSLSEQTSQASHEMKERIEQVARSSQEAAVIAKQADTASTSDKELALTVMGEMQHLETVIDEVAELLSNLSGEVNSVTQLLQSVRSISEQTNLLALNAAIEAARAGDSGRGFAVVADEVRALAQRTNNSTDEIQSVLENLHSSLSKTVEAMSVGRQQTETNVQEVSRIADNMNQRADDIRNVSSFGQEIAQQTHEQMTLVNTINSQIMGNTEAIQQLAEQMVQLAGEAEHIKQLAVTYQAKARVFKL